MKTNILEQYVSELENGILTENGGAAFSTSGDACVNLLFRGGALRGSQESEIVSLISEAYGENPLTATRLLFHIRDARGGMGERRFFRTAISWLAENHPDSVRKNIGLIPEYGRWDDAVSLLRSRVSKEVVDLIAAQLKKDVAASPEHTSLMAKWLPSVNASSQETRGTALILIKALGMTPASYRKTLSKLRAKLDLVENHMREKDYTFEYSAVPSVAGLKYRQAFMRNDEERYLAFLKDVAEGKAKINAATLAPHQIVEKCYGCVDDDERLALDVMWKALPSFESDESTIAVVDGSGSMFWNSNPVCPGEVALALGLYHAERNSGAFANSFITFGAKPQLVRVKGNDIVDKVTYCKQFQDCSNTNVEAVFELILDAAERFGASQSDMPAKVLILSDMEFDPCSHNAGETVFRQMKKKFKAAGYELPKLVFWNIESRQPNFPVSSQDEGVALMSGFAPAIMSIVTGEIKSPTHMVEKIVNSERYLPITA